MHCSICGSDNTEITYKGKIRNGAPGKMTDESISMYRCENCFTIWHECFSADNELYQTDDYRESIGEMVTLQEFYSKHDAEILDKLNYTGTEVYRDKLFMDIGCGGGGLADFIRTVASEAILIEPNANFAGQLRKKGYKVFAYADDALEEYENKIELIISFDVIEHVDNPQVFLSSIYKLLSPDGIAYIGTPTEYPVLRSLLGSEFDAFVFSTQHTWVFSREGLEYLARNCGFSAYSVSFYQRFGLGNLIAWLQTRQPKGEMIYEFITPTLQSHYKSEMARDGTAEYLVLKLSK